MSVEAGFLRAIQAAPQDDGLRLVYADWLEERMDRRAEFLRTQVLLTSLRPKDPRRAVVANRLRDLRQGLDAQWLAAVDRSRIENCDLQFRFECPQKWERLQPTENASVRYCNACARQVYYCHSVEEARSYAQCGECVAVDSTLVRRPGDVVTRRVGGQQPLPHCTEMLGRISLPSVDTTDEQENESGRRNRQRDSRRSRHRERHEPHDEDWQ
jgi:uncharacterized protein (TIGR02996 family)